MASIWPPAEPQPLLVLSGAVLQQVLDRDALIAAMAAAMLSFSTGGAVVPLRTMMRLPGGSVRVLAAMPGFLAGAGADAEAERGAQDRPEPAADPGPHEALGAKLVTVYPENPARGLESHYGLVVLFEAASGRPRAVLDGTFITTARTAAVSAVSVDLLARPDAAVLAVVGSGVQARAHLWALAAVRRFREARVVSRNAAHARALADAVTGLLPFPVIAVDTAAEAVRDADVVITATSAARPVVARRWLKPGVHIAAVGSSTPAARELDSDTVRDALLVVDSRTAALAEAGDVLIPLREGAIDERHIAAELGEVLAGSRLGRTDPGQITLYKSLGLAVQDLAAARLALTSALARGLGVSVAL